MVTRDLLWLPTDSPVQCSFELLLDSLPDRIRSHRPVGQRVGRLSADSRLTVVRSDSLPLPLGVPLTRVVHI